MRALWALVLLLLVSSAHSQGLGSAGGALQRWLIEGSRGLGQRKPTEASGFPTSPEDLNLPAPDLTTEDTDTLLWRNANDIRHIGEEFTATQDVRFSYKGYDCTADQVNGNERTQIFLLQGNVLIVGKDHVLRGDRILVNFKTNTFRYIDGRADLAPAFVGNGVAGDIYMTGSSGGQSAGQMISDESTFTTCDKPDPHYVLKSRRTTIIPHKKAIFRDSDLYILGHRVLHIPYLAIPLDQRENRYTPEVGHTSDDGYFIKTTFSNPTRGAGNFMNTHLDYFTKLGFGLGEDVFYENKLMKGIFRIYGITEGPKSVRLSWQHNMYLFGGILAIDSSYQKNNYVVAPSSTLTNVSAQYALQQKNGTSIVSYVLSDNTTGSAFKTTQTVLSVQDQRRWSTRLSTTTNLALNNNDTTQSDAPDLRRSQLDVKFSGVDDLGKVQAGLDYQRSIPIGTIQNFYSSSNETPLLTLHSDAGKLFGPKGAAVLPFTTNLAWGELANPGASDRVTRLYGDFAANKGFQLSGKQTLSFGTNLKQGIYSDNTAQYILNFTTNYQYSFTRKTAFNLGYTYLRHYG
ncbi:MAG: hypothetical protein ACRDQZ_09005, partial [Mycobacteriales bacterium]